METITVTKSLLSTTHYNYTALSTTHTGGEATPFLSFQMDLYYSTILIEPTKTTINTDSQKLVAISTTPRPEYEMITEGGSKQFSRDTSSSKYEQSQIDYHLTTVHTFRVLYPTTRLSEIGTNTIISTLSSPITTIKAYSSISKTTNEPQIRSVPTTTEYHATVSKKPYYVSILTTTVNIDSLSTTAPYHSTPFIGSAKTTISRGLQSITTAESTASRHTLLVSMVSQYSTTTLESEERTTAGSPTSTEQGIIFVDTYPSLSTIDQIERDHSRAVTTREAVAWALLSLVTLLFIGLLSVNATVICIQKCRQNKAHAPAYEMAGNPCYESSKINNTLETEIYESIETERVYV